MELQLRFMNVGYGEAILLRCPRENGSMFTMLIDGGSGEDAEFSGHPARVRSAEQLAALGVTHLDVVLNTHIHEDHTCGLPRIIRDIGVGEFWCGPLPEAMISWPQLDCALGGHPSGTKFQAALNAHREMLHILQARGIPVRQLLQGSKLPAYCENLSISVLGPSPEEADFMLGLLTSVYTEPDAAEQARLLLKADSMMNNHSVILMLTYHDVNILLCGDTNAEGFGYLHPAQLRADVFKLGHHGQLDSATPALVSTVSPRAVAVCASSDRRYNSMHPDILRMFEAHNPDTLFVLSDTPDLPPWSTGMPQHTASELTIGAKGQINLQYM